MSAADFILPAHPSTVSLPVRSQIEEASHILEHTAITQAQNKGTENPDNSVSTVVNKYENAELTANQRALSSVTGNTQTNEQTLSRIATGELTATRSNTRTGVPRPSSNSQSSDSLPDVQTAATLSGNTSSGSSSNMTAFIVIAGFLALLVALK